jgi:hypothetical protein
MNTIASTNLYRRHTIAMGSTLSPPNLVKEASENQAAVFLDVRTGDEIKEAHLKSRPFLHVSCTPDDCSELMAKADELLPNKNGTLLLVNVQHLVKRYN